MQARSAVGVPQRQRSVWAEAIKTGFTENGARTRIHHEEGGRRQGGPLVGTGTNRTAVRGPGYPGWSREARDRGAVGGRGGSQIVDCLEFQAEEFQLDSIANRE